MDPFIPLVAFGSFLFVRYYKFKFLKEEGLKEIDEDLSWRVTALTNGNYFEAPMDEKVVRLSSIFLGGGISGAKDWQKEVSKTLLSSCPGLVIYNPRR
jgi:hypothetical protein